MVISREFVRALNDHEEVSSICDYIDNPWREGSKTRRRVDWSETVIEHVIKVELPGLSREDVDIWVEEERKMIITAEPPKKELHKEEHTIERFFRPRLGEIWSGRFRHKFLLPGDANVNAITANLHDGVLTVVVKKHENGARREPFMREPQQYRQNEVSAMSEFL